MLKLLSIVLLKMEHLCSVVTNEATFHFQNFPGYVINYAVILITLRMARIDLFLPKNMKQSLEMYVATCAHVCL